MKARIVATSTVIADRLRHACVIAGLEHEVASLDAPGAFDVLIVDQDARPPQPEDLRAKYPDASLFVLTRSRTPLYLKELVQRGATATLGYSMCARTVAEVLVGALVKG
ncbi:MAG: hypothetical protein HS108_08105 [Planctomycetes bacterium]|nr:hypothetical protein [Planctomycetota bacterium]